MAFKRTEMTDIPNRARGWIHTRMLSVGRQLLVADMFGQKYIYPKKSGAMVIFRRYLKLAVVTAPLAEGVTPDPHLLEKEDVAAALQQWGAWVELTDVIIDTHEDPVWQQTAERLGIQMGETVENIRWNTLVAGTGVQYTNGAARVAVNTVVDRGDFALCSRTLQRNLARRFTRLVAPGRNFATFAVRPAYWAVTHVDIEFDVRQCTGFIPAENYPSNNSKKMGEIGSVGDFRVVCTTTTPYWAGGGAAGGVNVLETAAVADVYPIVCFGEDAYGVVPMSGYDSFKLMVLQPGVARQGDQLGQLGSAGWKTWQAVCITNDDWMQRIETACTAVPGP